MKMHCPETAVIEFTPNEICVLKKLCNSSQAQLETLELSSDDIALVHLMWGVFNQSSMILGIYPEN